MTATLIRARSPSAKPPVIISVNGTMIPRSAIAREAQHHPADSALASWHAAAEALVIRELLLQEARAQDVRASPLTDEALRRETDEEAQIRELVDREVTVPVPTEEELRRCYDAMRSRFRSPELCEARHILIAARASDAEAYAAARAKAEALAVELAAEPGLFEALARDHSACASAGEGGYLGQLTPEETTPEFSAALTKLAEGETTREPVETRYGFHLIRLERRIIGKDLPFEAVSARIGEYLADRARHTATAQYIARLVSRAEIFGIEIAGAVAHRVN